MGKMKEEAELIIWNAEMELVHAFDLLGVEATINGFSKETLDRLNEVFVPRTIHKAQVELFQHRDTCC